jgi:hypothetical protein
MNDLLEKLGAGALLAWIALPVLALTVRRSRSWEPLSRQRALAWVLVLDGSLLAAPWVREWVWARASSVLPSAWIERVAAAPLMGAGPPPQATDVGWAWTPLAWCGAAWLALVAVGVVRATLRAVRLKRLCVGGTSPSAATLSQVDAAARVLRIRPPYVVCSDETAVPFVTGMLHPTLVLPPRLMSSLDGVAADLALRHELIHLARLDHWRAAGLGLLGLPLWPHPTAGRLGSEWVLAREEAVDDDVAPSSPLAYTRLLVDAARLRAERVVAMASGDLARRIARLTDATVLPQGRVDALIVCFCVVAGLIVAVPRAAARTTVPAAGLTAPAPAAGPLTVGKESEVDLRPGAQTTLTVRGLKQIAVGDPGIADVRSLDSDHVQVTAVGEGRTTLLIWTKTREIFSFLVVVKTLPVERVPELPPRVNLAIGQERKISVKGLERIAIGDPGVVDVTPEDDGLRLVGRAPGKTTLMVWLPGGRGSTLVSVP